MKKLLVLILLTLLVGPAAAQDANPLLDMLALVPDNDNSRFWLNYADYRALEAARGIEEKPSFEDFEHQTEKSSIWFAASRSLMTGMRLNFFWQYLTDMPDLVGFSLFDINQSLTFGEPPSLGIILNGDFDPNQIATAYTARDFIETPRDEITLWCMPLGCDSMFKLDIANRNPGDPFGGQLGRAEPLAVISDNLLANSADTNVVEDVIATITDSKRSLADAPDYRAVAEALPTLGHVGQVQFINPADMIFTGANPEIPADLPEFKELPLYSLAVLADTWQGDEQTAWIGLTYVDVETAQAAADEVIARFETFVSWRTKRPFSELLTDFDAEISEPVIYEGTNKVVMLLPIVYPIPTNEVPEGETSYRASSLLFRELISEYFTRSLYVLAIDLP